MGIPLNEIPDIRAFYGKPDRYGHDAIDFMTEDYAPIRNHIIAARVTAENPDEARTVTSKGSQVFSTRDPTDSGSDRWIRL